MTIDINKLRRLAQAATLGPWYVTGKLTRYVEARIDGGLIQEVAACGPTKADGGYGPQQEANARLIAAAPDLLEACKTFAEWLGREERGFASAGNKRDTPEGERAWRDWYNENLRLCALAQEQARAAIARATGDQP